MSRSELRILRMVSLARISRRRVHFLGRELLLQSFFFFGRRCLPPGRPGCLMAWTKRSVGRQSNGTVFPGGNSNSRRRRRIEIRVVLRCPSRCKDVFDAERNRRFEWVNCGVCAGRWLEFHRGLLSFKRKLQVLTKFERL